MKWAFAIAGGLLFHFQSSGQNLITNPSFEDACASVCVTTVGGNVYNGCIPGWQTSHQAPDVFRNSCPLISGEQASDGTNYLYLRFGGVFTEVNLKRCFPYNFKMDYQQALNAVGICTAGKIIVAGANALNNGFPAARPNIPHEIITEVLVPNVPSNTWQGISINFETVSDWKYLWIYYESLNSRACNTTGVIDNLSLTEDCNSPLGCSADFTWVKIGDYNYKFNSSVSGGSPGTAFSSLVWTFTNTVTGNQVISTETNPAIGTLPCPINDPNCDFFLPPGKYLVCIEAQFTNVFTGEDCFAEYCEEIELEGFEDDEKFSSKRLATNGDPSKSLQVFPNPAKDYLEVRFNDGSPVQEYALWNLNGQLVKNGTLSDQSAIDIGQIPNGTYLLKVTSEKQEYRYKVTIVH
ncbi:MAG: T9SS type A sorting domain-containing protein [Salibacteraceae bacterium]